MKTWGILLAVLGLIVGAGALMMETTVFSPGMPSIGGYGGSEPSRTHNLGLLQQQELFFIGGCALFVAGCVLAAIGQLEAAVVRSVRTAASIDGGVVTDAGDQPVRREYVAPEYELDDVDTKRWIAAAFLIGLVIIVLVYALAPGKSPEARALEANAEMLADNLEAQADNLEALSNTIR